MKVFNDWCDATRPLAGFCTFIQPIVTMKNPLCALCCFLCLSSCHTLNSDIDHLLMVDKIIDSAQRAFDTGRQQEALQYLDNAYAGFTAGPGDLFRKYQFKKD